MLERALMTLGQLIYLPVAVAVVRILSCRKQGPLGLDVRCNALSGNCVSEVSCVSVSHGMAMAFAVLAFAVVLVGVPYSVLWSIKHGVIHDSTSKHAEHLKRREAERLLGLSDKWENFHFHAFSSFKRKQVHYKLRSILLMLWLAVISVLTGPDVSTINYTEQPFKRHTQVLCFVVGLAVDLLFDVLLGFPYRCGSSTLVMLCFKLNLFVTGMYAVLRAMDLSNSFLVDRSLSEFLKGQSLVAGCVIFLLYAWCLKWGRWPTDKSSLRQEVQGSHDLIIAIRESRAVLARYQLAQREFVDIEAVDARIDVHQQQLDHMSLFRPTAREVMEQLVNMKRSSLASSFMGLRSLRNAMATFRQRLDARDRSMRFLTRSRKMILLKLLVIRCLVGDRKFQPLIDFDQVNAKSRDVEQDGAKPKGASVWFEDSRNT